MEWNQKREHLFDGNHHRESSIYKTGERLFIGQYLSSKAPEIKRLDEIEERFFGNEDQSNYKTDGYYSMEHDWSPEAREISPGIKEMENSFDDKERFNQTSNCQKGEHLFGGEVRYLEGTRTKVPDQMVESFFKEEDRYPEDHSIDTRHQLNTRGTDSQVGFSFKEDGYQEVIFNLERNLTDLATLERTERTWMG